MILVLNIISRQKAEYLLLKNKQVVYHLPFDLLVDQDQVLARLFFLLHKNKLQINKIKAFALLFQAGSLTQVKVITATINALAWQSGAKVYADYGFSGQTVQAALPNILKNINKIKKFKPLKVVYSRAPEITMSQKKHKFILLK